MDCLVKLSNVGAIGLVTIDNPPVNALSPTVRVQILESILKIHGNQEVAAIILLGAGRGFSAGADLKLMEKISARLIPRGDGPGPIWLQLEDSCKPIVAAMHGTAYGGGLE